jgi:hypothetical protein
MLAKVTLGIGRPKLGKRLSSGLQTGDAGAQADDRVQGNTKPKG